jgi:F-type H+-transporting ATPase subunit b
MIKVPEGNFLVPDATALVEAAVFLVVLFVVTKWVAPRLSAALDDRRRRIEQELRAASEAVADAKRLEQRAQDVLRDARREARVIIDGAYERHDFLVEEGKRKGREEYEWLSGVRAVPSQVGNKELVEAGRRSS